MTFNSQNLPRNWDPGLEELLKAPLCTAVRLSNIPWSEQTVDKIIDTKTFIEAINVDQNKERSVICTENPLLSRSKRIGHIINAPLSPRKPIIIPCSNRKIRQRDKQNIEKIYRQRNRLLTDQTLSQIPKNENKEEESSVSDPVVPARSASSIGKNVTRLFPLSNLRYSSVQPKYFSFMSMH